MVGGGGEGKGHMHYSRVHVGAWVGWPWCCRLARLQHHSQGTGLGGGGIGGMRTACSALRADVAWGWGPGLEREGAKACTRVPACVEETQTQRTG